EHGDSGRARAWTLRAVRALHDPVWTADGYVSDRWRPVSPVTGRLDAFQWQTPLAALPSDKAVTVESTAFSDAMLTPRRIERPQVAAPAAPTEPPPQAPEPPTEETAPPLATQDNSPIAPAPTTDAAAVPPPLPDEPPAPSPSM